jgi:Tfp pilus assembly protein PilN
MAAATVAAIASAVGWWWIRSEVRRLDRAIAIVDVEVSRLRESARQSNQINARKSELTAKLASISREHSARIAPVQLLDVVGRHVPDDLWFTGAEQRGTRLELTGRALTLTAVTDFVDRLQRSGAVSAPVEILSASAETRGRTTVVRFSARLN